MDTCEATYACCACSLEAHSPEVPHKCGEPNCQGSWNWVDGEFVVVELPRAFDVHASPLGAFLAMFPDDFSIPRGGIRHRNHEKE